MRVPIVAGNWKMNKTSAEAVELVRALRAGIASDAPVDTVLCPPFTALASVAEELAGSPFGLGAQNVHTELSGAYTGEISAPMLRDLGCSYVIVGHSERRTCFGEDDTLVNRKAHAVLEAGLCPIICFGETLEQHEAGLTQQVVKLQLQRGLEGLGDALTRTVLAYEPVWAIGTGRTATADQAQAIHAFGRALLAELAGRTIAESVRIQYGGSVKPSNARELFSQPDIDGGLIGGAALDAGPFLQIVNAAVPAPGG